MEGSIMTTPNIIKRREYNYADHTYLFENRLKENLTEQELKSFLQLYFERSCFSQENENVLVVKKETQSIIVILTEILNTLEPINSENYGKFVITHTYGICGNLELNIYGFIDDDNNMIYDIIHCFSKLFYKQSQEYINFFNNPIPSKSGFKVLYCWEEEGLKYRLLYIKWLSTQIKLLIPVLEQKFQ